MKKIILITIAALFSMNVFAQTNIFPTTGNVGIGTSNPTTMLEVKGSLKVTDPGAIDPILFITGSPNEPNDLIKLGDINNVGNGQLFTIDGANSKFTFINGKVGIGTISPNKQLDVNGDINLTGNLYKNGSIINLSVDSTIWQQNASNIYFNTGNVGIGTTTPAEKLQVEGNLKLLNSCGYIQKVKGIYLGWDSSYGTQFNHGIFSTDGTSYSDDITVNSYGNIRINFDSNSNGTNTFSIGHHTTGLTNTLFTITENGYVGIGTSTPAGSLDIQGHPGRILFEDGDFSFRIMDVNGNNVFNVTDLDGSKNNQLVITNTGIGIGTDAPKKKLDVNGDINISGNLFKNNVLMNIWQSNSSNIYYNSGNVGIGTTNPTADLDIVSDVAPVLKLRTTGDGTTYTPKFDITGAAQGGNIGEINFLFGGDRNDNIPDASIIAYNHSAENVADLVFYTSRGTGYLTQKMVIKDNGNVGIGTTNPTYKLSVKGTIGCSEVKVEDVTSWSDFVFEPEYKLMSLKDLETFIKDNKHLPEIPTTTEVKENGIAVGEMNAKLLQKIEELTLYVIELKKEVEILKEQSKQ